MTTKGRILLLGCGHIQLLDKAVEMECLTCDRSDVLDSPDNPFLLGYKAGLGVQLGFDAEGVERLAKAWLKKVSGEHSQSCQCGPCKVARKIFCHGAKWERGDEIE